MPCSLMSPVRTGPITTGARLRWIAVPILRGSPESSVARTAGSSPCPGAAMPAIIARPVALARCRPRYVVNASSATTNWPRHWAWAACRFPALGSPLHLVDSRCLRPVGVDGARGGQRGYSPPAQVGVRRLSLPIHMRRAHPRATPLGSAHAGDNTDEHSELIWAS